MKISTVTEIAQTNQEVLKLLRKWDRKQNSFPTKKLVRIIDRTFPNTGDADQFEKFAIISYKTAFVTLCPNLNIHFVNKEDRWAIHRLVYMDHLGNLTDKQKEIADHITNIRNQAQALKDKTKELLKKASEEIEEIILN